MCVFSFTRSLLVINSWKNLITVLIVSETGDVEADSDEDEDEDEEGKKSVDEVRFPPFRFPS